MNKLAAFQGFLGEPVAIHEPTFRQLVSATISAEAPTEPAAINVDDYVPTAESVMISDDVALVPIHGVMVKRTRVSIGWFSDRVMLGSDHLAALIDQLAADPGVRVIVLDVDTPGGQVAGTERLADAIHAASQVKEVIGVVNETAASGGLWAISQASRIVASASASIGSLGVYLVHVDDTELFQKIGIARTPIFRGELKGIGDRPLDDAGKASLQAFVDSKFELFVAAVARGRLLSEAAVVERWGDSQMMSGREALASGLVDEIGTLQGVLMSVSAGRIGRSAANPAEQQIEGGNPMSIKLNAAGKLTNDAGQVLGTVEDLDLSAKSVEKLFSAQVKSIVDDAVAAAVAEAVEAAEAKAEAEAKAGHKRLEDLAAAVGFEAGVAAFLAGKSVVDAKADHADTLAAQLKERDDEIKDLREKAAAAGTRRPGFSGSDTDDSASSGGGDAGDSETDGDKELKAAWDKNAGDCRNTFRNFEEFAAMKRYEARQAS